jgi:formate dehydrogenase subunit delta
VNGQQRLIYMANQIARNFGAMAHDDAVAATADHIRMFWDPRMKAKVFADTAGLGDVAAAAIEALRRGAEPEPQTRATRFNAVDEAGHSDAG